MKLDEFIQNIKKIDLTDSIVDLTVALCSKKTINPPGNEYLCNEILENKFEEMGVTKIDKYEKAKGRTNLVGIFAGGKPGPTVAIIGHTDVVPVEGQDWTNNPFEPKIQNGKIFARGAIDNKGPFASVIEGVAEFLKQVNNEFEGKIMLVSAADEEKGSKFGIKHLFEELKLECDYALVPDGGEFSEMVFGEMGVLKIILDSKGKTYHGSMPEMGNNALIPLAMLAERLHSFDWNKLESSSDKFDNTVLNVGKLNGGIADNIIPDKAEMVAMWRYPVGVNKDMILEIVDNHIAEIKKKYDFTDIKYEIKQLSTPFISNQEGDLIKYASESATKLDLPMPKAVTIRGETVAKYIYQACGAEVLVNGPQDGSMGLMHQADEYVEIESLNAFAKYYSLILFKLLKSQN